jgi:hypothetical protein
MHSIQDLLERFKGILDTEDSKKENIIKILEENTSIVISAGDIDVKKGKLFLKVKPIYKNAILLKKDKILEDLRLSFGDKYIQDIY